MSSSDDDNVKEYRHDEKRTNNPPAGLASYADEGDDEKVHYNLDPHLPPKLRFDQTGEADELPDELPELLQKAVDEGLTEDEAQTIAKALQQKQDPWLEWTNKRQKEDVEVSPTALHTHERVSAQAIVRALKREDIQHNLFADPDLPYHEAVEFYEHDVDWTNRLILGDSLEVMSSLAHREDLAGEVQMIYVDPPYGIDYKSNFQPKTTSRSVSDTYSDLTREPEMVKAYRDTWRLGIHSYLDYMRDRLVICRELLKDSGSLFVQINDRNVHLIRSLLDEVFGRDNFVVTICFKKKSYQAAGSLAPVNDYILWVSKNKSKIKNKPLFRERPFEGNVRKYNRIESPYGEVRSSKRLSEGEIKTLREKGWRLRRDDADITSQDPPSEPQPFDFQGSTYEPPPGRHWSQKYPERMKRLARAGRIRSTEDRLYAVKYWSDSPITPISNIWEKTAGAANPLYVVQTTTEAVKRCILMSTDPGDLVLDPTCGSGTTAFVAEKYGRRWVTIDTSRVAISLARQRLLTSTYPNYKIREEASNDPGDGFEYKTAPDVTLNSIAQNSAIDSIHKKYESELDDLLNRANDALSEVDDTIRHNLEQKLQQKQKEEGKRAITDADKRRWSLPAQGDSWDHWEVPFDTDDDWPAPLKEAVASYREVWKEKQDKIKTAIREGSEQQELYDQPKIETGVTRVSGPFTVEAVMPPEQSLSGDGSPIGGAPDPMETTFDVEEKDGEADSKNADAYLEKMTHLMEKDGIRFMDNKELDFSRLERMEGATYLHAEGVWESGNGEERVAISFGPQHGPVTGKQAVEAMHEAHRRGYDAGVVAGFSFDDAAQTAVQKGGKIDFHMAHIRPDVVMEDLLYRPEKEQIFTVFGLPRTSLQKTETGKFQIEMEGVDVYDPVKGQINATKGSKVAAWFVDTDYNGRTFCICQAFFPNTPGRSGPWKDFKRDLSDRVDDDKLDQLSGTTSLPFEAGEHECAAVKVIDPRGNEVMRVLDLS
ncbi:adenine-specific DNA-methyltransferase [Salinibacter ruber]|uniref:site-specific DNA-methyltransferase n=1 Tax=Salinibacter ruber TaxID=146919 RepID=UPI002167D630|nr:site-specific DNA-methyltransferase [Salinibacter ruber]MCS4191266.1 adenine-specific DNA-methyltransferase [Salinibacter ruber]